MHRTIYGAIAIFTLLFLAGCQPLTPIEAQQTASPASDVTAALPIVSDSPSTSPAEAASADFAISSSGIVNGVILDAYGARGSQKTNGIPSRSFALSLQNIPENTTCLALSVIDPDGGNWVHWLAVGLPAEDLAENASIDLADNMVQGKNDFGSVGYGGPTPPSGTHKYVVTVYALSSSVNLENGFSKKQFQEAIDPVVIASATITRDYAH